MKIISIILLLFLNVIESNAQSDIFILVDVSGNPINSINKINIQERHQAIDLCKQIIKGKVSVSDFPNWEPKSLDSFVKDAYSNTGKSILTTIENITVIPYGDIDTYKGFKIFQNKSSSISLDQAINFASNLRYKDQLTFGKLAHAKAADIAIDANIKTYYLFEISGLGGDQTGSKGISRKQQTVIDKYESSVIIEPIGLFRLKNKPLSISIKLVNVKKLGQGSNTSGSKGIIQAKNVNKKVLKLLNPIGTKNKHTSIKEEDSFFVSWNCLGCNKNTKFTIKATNIRTNKSITKSCSGKNSLNMDLKAGIYKISLKGKGISSCQNNNQYIEITGGGSGGTFFFILLLLVIAGGILYIKTKDPFGWWDKNKKKHEIKEESNSESLY